jgi:peptidyl-prolyl cis-trans isomerase D
VTEFKPASVRPLPEVSAGIRQKLEMQQAADLAMQQGTKLLEQLQRGEKASVSWKAAQSITRNQRSGIEPELAQAVFRADTGKLPVYVGVKARNGYLLGRIDAVKESALSDENKRSGYAQQIRQITGEELLTVYLADLRKRADITMKDFAAEEKK